MRLGTRFVKIGELLGQFLKVIVLFASRRGYLFWPMWKSLSSFLTYLQALHFAERMRLYHEQEKIKSLANIERYSGNQSQRDYFNSRYGSMQRELEFASSGITNSTRILGRSFSSSFGHSAYGIGDRMRAKKLGLDKHNYILLGNQLANSWLIDKYWSKFLSYVRLDEWMIDCLEIHSAHLFDDIEYLALNEVVLGSEVGACAVELAWQERFPNDSILKLDEEDREYGYERLQAEEIKGVDSFITFHFRNRRNEVNRNVDPLKYLPAIDLALASGAHVFVIGEDASLESKIKHPRFKNFSVCNGWDARFDLFLLGECRFMVGASSGPIDVPPLFGKGVLWTNCNNLTMNRLHKESLLIPRLRVKNQLPTFEEFLNDINRGLYENDSVPDRFKGIEVLENSEDDIARGLEEMLTKDWNIPPNGRELEVLNEIKSRSGVISNRLSLKFLSKYFD